MYPCEIVSELELEGGSSFVTSKATLKRLYEVINNPTGDEVILEIETNDRESKLSHTMRFSEEDLWAFYNWLGKHLPGLEPVGEYDPTIPLPFG